MNVVCFKSYIYREVHWEIFLLFGSFGVESKDFSLVMVTRLFYGKKLIVQKLKLMYMSLRLIALVGGLISNSITCQSGKVGVSLTVIENGLMFTLFLFKFRPFSQSFKNTISHKIAKLFGWKLFRSSLVLNKFKSSESALNIYKHQISFCFWNVF